MSLLGTSRNRQETRAPADAKGLSEVVVRDLEGKEIRLGDLWTDVPAVLVFLRHYG